MGVIELIDKLHREHRLEHGEYRCLIELMSDEAREYAAGLAVQERVRIYGHEVYTRGLIEISNHCRNDCLYCGIRRSNSHVHRYRLSAEEIIACADEGYELGFRTFVLQGGEDSYYTDELLCDIIGQIKKNHPDCAVTLSLGERGYDSFKRLYDAGADRYLLRHETASKAHYERLHQVGCGFMVGSPCQTADEVARDLKFIEEFRPDMCGIGPFIPHHDTAFAHEPAGTVELTCYLLSLIRLIHPRVLLPATTALGTIHPRGREIGIEPGANVVMPNLSPVGVRRDYELYDDKICTGEESAQCRSCLADRMESIGYHIVTDRGDVKRYSKRIK